MTRFRWKLLAGLGLACVLGRPAVGFGQVALPPPVLPAAAAPAFQELAVRDLVAKIDRHLAADWARNGIKPAEPASDAEFMRRVYLDVVGRIPKVSEVRAFVDDRDPAKRAKLVDKLLESPGYLNHFGTVIRHEWLPQATDNPQFRFLGVQFESWLHNRLRENVGQDRLVRELLTAPTNFNRGPRPVNFDPNNVPIAFYQANENKPENLAASASRLFLGVKLECAQCHDHPFAEYKRDQFWQFAAFFAEIQPINRAVNLPPGDPMTREIKIPNTTRTVQATFFDGTEPKWKEGVGTRQTFAEWLTSPENPYFARNAANRMWSHFFGFGFTEPIDEPSDDNQPTVPELLDDLAKAYVAQGFDNKFLIRALTRSKAYQLTSRMTDPSQRDARRFARMNVKGLVAEQLFDSLAAATGYRDPTPPQQRRFAFAQNNARGQFLNKFASNEKRTERQTSILQALTLMNGQFIADQTSLERSEILAAVVDSPFMTTEDRVETLFMAALSRRPTPPELEKFSSYVDRGGPSGDKKKALGDVFWALLNSSEFMLNH